MSPKLLTPVAAEDPFALPANTVSFSLLPDCTNITSEPAASPTTPLGA